MSTLFELRRSYAREMAHKRGYFLDAVVHENWHRSTDRLLASKLAKTIKPRGRAYERLLKLDLAFAQHRSRIAQKCRKPQPLSSLTSIMRNTLQP